MWLADHGANGPGVVSSSARHIDQMGPPPRLGVWDCGGGGGGGGAKNKVPEKKASSIAFILKGR